MSIIKHRQQLHRQQQGMVSILVTMLMMIIISLIVLGFAQVSRREQRQTLDSQLSTQAYYAAESGINDARAAVLQKLTTGTVPAKTSCGNDSNYTLNPNIDGSNTVSYPCMLIDPTPTALTYTVSSRSTVVPIISSTGTFGAGGITLTWNKPAADVATPYTNCLQNSSLGKLPPAVGTGPWACPYGLLQADIVPIPAGSISRTALTNNTKAVFLEPVQGTSVPAGGNNFSMATGTAGSVIAGKCDDTKCTANVTNMPGGSYYMRISAVYKSNFNLTISTPGGTIGFKDAQVILDATGKAQDVIRRVRVAMDLTDANSSDKSGAAIISQDSICKRFSVANGYYNNAATYPGGTDNPLCQSDTSGTLTTACVAPHDIILTLDTSDSMNRDWEGVTRGAELEKVADTFVDSTGVSADGNHVSVVSFNRDPTIDIGFSSDPNAIKAAIAGRPQVSGTNYMDGLTSSDSVFNTARAGVPKVMIFISDGKPDSPKWTPDDIVNYTTTMKAKGITVYAVGIVDGDEGANILNRMASDPISTYYTTATTHLNFEDYFAGISSEVTC